MEQSRGGGPSMAQYCLGNTLGRPTNRIEIRVRHSVLHCRTASDPHSCPLGRRPLLPVLQPPGLQPLGASDSSRSSRPLRCSADLLVRLSCPAGGRLQAACRLVPPRRRPAWPHACRLPLLPAWPHVCLSSCLLGCLLNA